MPLTIPPAVNYQSPLIALPSRIGAEPAEGRKAVPCEINWVSMGGAQNCVAFNLQNNATLNVSQICALKVDNSACGMDVQFVFPDTGETIVIPAYSPTSIVPVFSNGTAFFVIGLGMETTDTTRFQILNYLPPPVSIPTTQEQSVSQLVSSAITLGGPTQVLSNAVSGTLEGAVMTASISNTIQAYDVNVIINDGTGHNLLVGTVAGPANSSGQFTLFNVMPIALRFNQGITITIAAGTQAPSAGTGWLTGNFFYRAP